MTRDQALKIINDAAIPQDKKDELAENLKSQTVTKKEAQAIIELLDKNMAELQSTAEKEALLQIFLDTKKQLDSLYKEYEKTMDDLDKQAKNTFTQASEYIDKLKIEDIRQKIE